MAQRPRSSEGLKTQPSQESIGGRKDGVQKVSDTSKEIATGSTSVAAKKDFVRGDVDSALLRSSSTSAQDIRRRSLDTLLAGKEQRGLGQPLDTSPFKGSTSDEAFARDKRPQIELQEPSPNVDPLDLLARKAKATASLSERMPGSEEWQESRFASSAVETEGERGDTFGGNIRKRETGKGLLETESADYDVNRVEKDLVINRTLDNLKDSVLDPAHGDFRDFRAEEFASMPHEIVDNVKKMLKAFESKYPGVEKQIIDALTAGREEVSDSERKGAIRSERERGGEMDEMEIREGDRDSAMERGEERADDEVTSDVRPKWKDGWGSALYDRTLVPYDSKGNKISPVSDNWWPADRQEAWEKLKRGGSVGVSRAISMGVQQIALNGWIGTMNTISTVIATHSFPPGVVVGNILSGAPANGMLYVAKKRNWSPPVTALALNMAGTITACTVSAIYTYGILHGGTSSGAGGVGNSTMPHNSTMSYNGTMY